MKNGKFTGHDYTIEIYNHATQRYDREPDQNFLITLWDFSGKFCGNFGGFERIDQAEIAAEALRRGLAFAKGVRDILTVETDCYHDEKEDEAC